MASTKETTVWNGAAITTTDPNSGSPEDLDTMEEALRAFLCAGHALSAVWQHDGCPGYPHYLPNFDEFLADFAELMDKPGDNDTRSERRDAARTDKRMNLYQVTYENGETRTYTHEDFCDWLAEGNLVTVSLTIIEHPDEYATQDQE